MTGVHLTDRKCDQMDIWSFGQVKSVSVGWTWIDQIMVCQVINLNKRLIRTSNKILIKRNQFLHVL